MLAQVEAGRADQVAHVLDHQQIDVRQIELRGGRGGHVGVEMAGPFGVDLHDGHAQGLHPLGVDRAGDVALDDRRAEAIRAR